MDDMTVLIADTAFVKTGHGAPRTDGRHFGSTA